MRCFVVLLCLAAFQPLFAQQPHALDLTGEYWGAHDPSAIKAGDTWYVFATGRARDGGQFQIRSSIDLHAWQLCGHVFDEVPDWIKKESPGTRDLWAPDISFENGEYRLYYAYSLFGKNTSGIALATNRTLDRNNPHYKWVDRGLVLRSIATDNFNAIDPNFVLDAKHHAWLAFGSFWSGIKLHRLDSQTGLASRKDAKVYPLAARARPEDAAPASPGLPANWQAIEAPFIVRHDGYYYLFVSWDLCCRGLKSSYRTMVGRSKKVTGPYVDDRGVSMMKGGGTQVLSADARWLGPGGESLLLDSPENLLFFHAYDAHTGKPALQISTIVWSGGWPHAALQQ
jgi:arabinan endo-1,5-alpha-L-arabinosidase